MSGFVSAPPPVPKAVEMPADRREHLRSRVVSPPISQRSDRSWESDELGNITERDFADIGEQERQVSHPTDDGERPRTDPNAP